MKRNIINNILVAAENKNIVRNKCYKIIELEEQDFSGINFTYADAYSPEMLSEIEKDITQKINADFLPKATGNIEVSDRGSFRYSEDSRETLVMNFANAYYTGGAYLVGGDAQEESLCRMSTLYASLKSENARKMYDYNNAICKKFRAAASDYMIISPEVVVFRNGRNELLKNYYITAVCTIAAYDRRKSSSSEKEIEQLIEKRLIRFLALAVSKGYKKLVLGAWGCGVFKNNPETIARNFKKLLIDKGYVKYFDNVIFAIPARYGINNFRVFTDVFKEYITRKNSENNRKIIQQFSNMK